MKDDFFFYKILYLFGKLVYRFNDKLNYLICLYLFMFIRDLRYENLGINK